MLVFTSLTVLMNLFGITTKKLGTISARDAYDYIVCSFSPPAANLAESLLWTKALPKKISCFIWLVLRNRILTWENLQKRGNQALVYALSAVWMGRPSSTYSLPALFGKRLLNIFVIYLIFQLFLRVYLSGT